MRSRLIILVLAAAAALALPAAAHAKLTVGISENSPGMFSHPLFPGLGAKHARVVMAYNVMTSGNHELARVTQYLNAARAARVTPLVTFEHATGDASICNKRRNFRRAVCRLPSQRSYRSNVRKFFAAFPWVRVVAPWNEVNHFTQPTSRNPKAAAKFTNTVAKLCRRCTIVAADMLDQADKICGIHNYSDVNRFRATGTKAIMRALGCRQYWLTETGGLFKFGSFWTKRTRKGCKNAAGCQLKATKYMFKLARRNRRIKRLYVYTYFGKVTPRFDAGLVDNRTGKARKAYREVKKRI